MIKSMGVHCVLGFLLLCVSLIRAEDYVLLGEPDFDIWDAYEQNQMSESEKVLELLCENYHITYNNERIECSNIQLTAKELLTDDDNHVISKRAADDESEGSGNGENGPVEITLYNETSVDVPFEETPLKTPLDETPVEEAPEKDQDSQINLEARVAEKTEEKEEQPAEDKEQPSGNGLIDPIIVANAAENKEEPADEKSTNITENKETSTQSQPVINLQPVPAESTTKQADVEEPVVIATQEPAAVESGSETGQGVPPLVQEAAENKDASENESGRSMPPLVHEIPRSETTIRPPAQASEAPATVKSAVQEKESAVVEDSESDKEGMRTATKKVLPSDLAEVGTTKNPKESEVVDDQQSGSAVMLKEPKVVSPVNVEGSDGDKQMAGLDPSAKMTLGNKPSESEQPNAGESGKTVTKAGKDTTILVVLFVIVIVIGAAAFTHNFIKKRKQKASENSEVVNGIRRSLQNLTSGNGKNAGDVEQGTEMKPLMKPTNNPVTVKEYSDNTKKDEQA